MTLSEIGNTPIDFAVLKSIFPDHKSIHNKVSELEKSGALIRLKKGMFVVSPNKSGKLLSLELIANHLYGPSYVSLQSALRYYGLIPESVYIVQSMTIKHSREFKNSLGRFNYTQCTKPYFSIGITQETNNNTTFLIARPEKALIDLIIHTPKLNLRFQKDILTYLEDDLRLNMEAFFKMDSQIFEQCLPVSKKKDIISNILKIIKQ